MKSNLILPNENQSPRVTLSLSFFDLERHVFFFFSFFSAAVA